MGDPLDFLGRRTALRISFRDVILFFIIYIFFYYYYSFSFSKKLVWYNFSILCRVTVSTESLANVGRVNPLPAPHFFLVVSVFHFGLSF